MEEDPSSVNGECGSAQKQPLVLGTYSLPNVLPPLPKRTYKLTGYKVIDIFNSVSYGDVYKVSKKAAPAELFAVKVMANTRNSQGDYRANS